MMPDDRITVEQLVRVRVPSHETLLDLSLSDALALHQGLDAIFQTRPICGWDPGDPQGSRQVMIRIPVTEPPAETGPSLQDDIEAMIAARGEKPAENPWDLVTGIVPESESREVDDADKQEAEFLSRLPQSSNTSEPPAEPETAPESPTQTNVVITTETREDKALRLWHQYRERHPEMPENRIVSRITAHYQGDRPSTDEVRGWLRARGVDLPEPLTRAQVAERMRAQRLAAAGERAEPPKAETPQAPEPVALSIDAFNPPSKLDWQDQLALTFEVLDNPDPDISPFWVAHCGLEAIEVYCNFVAKMRPAYKAMPPFKRTEFKEALSAKLRGKVAA